MAFTEGFVCYDRATIAEILADCGAQDEGVVEPDRDPREDFSEVDHQSLDALIDL